MTSEIMAKPSETSRIITAAAKVALAPLGCVRKGQSRVWRCDRRFWAVQIEFQPSGWGSGSYLNVGPEWFWQIGPGLSWSYRPTDFITFENAEQFRPLAEAMATIAAREVITLTERFRTLDDIYRHLTRRPLQDDWNLYDAAVVSALLGDLETSRAHFLRLETCEVVFSWQPRLKARSAELAALLDRPAQFQQAVYQGMLERRKALRLPDDPECLNAALACRESRSPTPRSEPSAP
jgi:hypothetical protein